MTTQIDARPRRAMRAPGPGAGTVALARVGVLLLGLLLLAGGAAPLRADPNYFEQRRIEAQALETFRRIITLWQEEVYFELYDHGMAASKARITREEFAQRMVELSWVPEGELSPRHLKAQYRFRTVVYVSARIPYRHKFNPDNRFSREQTLLLLQEDGQWKVDLIALVRAPFSGV
jgi:hypothetical protein